MKKAITTFMALVAGASLAMAQENKPAAAPAAAATATAAPAATADPVIMSSGSLQIHKSEFEAALKSLPAQYQQYAQGPGKRQFAEDYLRMKMLASQGIQNGLDKDPEVVQQLALMRENLVANAQLSRIEKGITVSDADLQKAYEDNKKEYDQVKARHILIAFKGSPAAQPGKKELTEDEAKAKAEEIRKQLVAGADFAEMAKKESDDVGSGRNGGDLGAFGRGQMVPEFDKAAFDGKVGEISPIIRTQYGFHILQVQEHGLTPFAQVKGTLEKKLHDEKLQAQIETMKSSATFDSSYFPPPAPPAAMAAPDQQAKPAATPAAASASTKKPEPKKPETKKPETKKPGTN